MRDYPKVNAQAINSHDVSREFFFQGIKNALADTSKIIYDKKDRKAGLFSTKTHDFLFYQRGFRASVYYQKKSEWNPTPFADITKYIAKDAGEIYSGDFIIDICMATDKENEEKRDKYLAVIKLVESDPSSELYPYLDHIKKLEGPKYAAKVGEVAEASYAATDLFELNNFFRQHKLSTNVIPDSFFLSLGDTLAEKISGQASDIIPRLNYLLNICTENNYAKKKQFTFGDGDSHIWLPTIPNAVCFDGQNFGFMAVQGKTTEDWQVYHFSREGYTNYKTDHQVIKNLPTIDKLYDITLTIEGGKITYAHGFVEHCQFTLNYATEVLVEKTGKYPEYPIDVYSYEYQKQYYAKNYHMSELEFLAQALLTIGGGFRVDSKGRLIDKSIPFDNEAMQCVVPKKPFTKINYCEMDKLKEIKKLGYLDSAWVIGLGKLLDALEENKPEVLASGYGSSTVPKVIKEGKSLLKNLAKDTIPTMKP